MSQKQRNIHESSSSNFEYNSEGDENSESYSSGILRKSRINNTLMTSRTSQEGSSQKSDSRDEDEESEKGSTFEDGLL